MRLQNIAALATALIAGACGSVPDGTGTMSFFVTSQGSGKGADFGGVGGADKLCQQLAEAAGASGMRWRAYLSSAAGNARDRIGDGPWYNAKGELIASSLAELHGAGNRIGKPTALSERGEVVNGRGDQPNMHDILTGSNPDGTLVAGKTCEDWTSSGAGTAIVGHHDRIGLRDDESSRSWNSSHASRGCGIEALRGTGGDGRIYCFAQPIALPRSSGY